MDDYILAAKVCGVITFMGLFVWLFGGAARMGEEMNDDVDEHETMIEEGLEESLDEMQEVIDERKRKEGFND